MLYLLDANVLITAHNLYYGIGTVPEFWAWLAHHGRAGNVKMPLEPFEEVKDGSNDEEADLLYAWIRDDDNKAAILLAGEEVDQELVARVLREGYAPNLNDGEIEQIGRDPFLIAYALADPAERCVVTTEVSRPTLTRQNRRIPDVCKTMGVQCCDTFAMTRALKFSTKWAAD
jgi:hypothetical protein